MEILLNLIVSIISGIIAGGFTSYAVTNRYLNISKTKGKNSPVINGQAEKNHFGDNVFNYPKNKSIQIKTITELIILIGEKANNQVREDSEKDLVIKLDDRFLKYREDLKNRYSELLDVYSQSYTEAIKYIENIEIISDKIALFLREKSRECLSANGGNPLLGLKELVKYFADELDKNLCDCDQCYDHVAVEFYLFKELINCNIFPNPIDNSNENR